jgi:hypothetical protein
VKENNKPKASLNAHTNRILRNTRDKSNNDLISSRDNKFYDNWQPKRRVEEGYSTQLIPIRIAKAESKGKKRKQKIKYKEENKSSSQNLHPDMGPKPRNKNIRRQTVKQIYRRNINRKRYTQLRVRRKQGNNELQPSKTSVIQQKRRMQSIFPIK